MREKKINFLEERIRRYLFDISRQELVKGQGSEVNGLISLLDSMERIGDVITKQVVPLLKKKERIGGDSCHPYGADGRPESDKHLQRGYRKKHTEKRFAGRGGRCE